MYVNIIGRRGLAEERIKIQITETNFLHHKMKTMCLSIEVCIVETEQLLIASNHVRLRTHTLKYA